MKRITRIITSAAAALALAATLVTASFADEENGIVLSGTSFDPGDEFTVSLVVPPAKDCDTASVRVTFDDSAFEGIEFEPDVPGSFSNLSNGIIALSAANVERAIKLDGGLTLTAKMKVKDDAPDGFYDFVLAENSFCFVTDNGWDFEEVWFPETTKVTVTVGDPDPAAAVTAADTGEPVFSAEVTQPAPTVTVSAAADAPEATENKPDNSIFTIVVIAIIAVVVIAIIFAAVALFKPKKKD